VYIHKNIPSKTFFKRKTLQINDNFKKIVIVGGMAPTYIDDKGILILNIFDFLLDDNSLDI
jgi:hypothetical protein